VFNEWTLNTADPAVISFVYLLGIYAKAFKHLIRFKMDISADVAAIVKQAPEWNFAGDCALLELMKRISQVGVDLKEKKIKLQINFTVVLFFRICKNEENTLVTF